MDKEQLLQQYKKLGFGYYEREQIELAIEHGLSEEEIDIIAKLEYHTWQMMQIRLLLEYNKTAERKLTEDQINFITNADLDWYKMRFIKICYENNVPQNEIENLLNKGFDEGQFSQINQGLENGLTIEEVKVYAKPELNEKQMRQINVFKQMEEIRLLLEFNAKLENKYILNDLQFIVNPELKSSQLEEIRLLLESNATLKNRYPLKELQFITNPKFNQWQIEEFCLGLENGLTPEQIQIYAKPEFNYYQMEQIRLAIEHNLTPKQIDFITNPNLEWYEMKLVRVCYEYDISQKAIEELLIKGFNSQQIEEICNSLKHGLSLNKINFIANSDLKYHEMQFVRLCYENNVSQNEIEYLLNAGYSRWQMDELTKGLENKLTLDEVKIYAKSEFDESQMKEIRLGLENGLTLDEIKIYTNPQFYWLQMKELRLGFENGLTIESLKPYANPKYNAEQIEQIRYALEYNLTAEEKITKTQIKFMTSLKDEDKMNLVRVCYENNISQLKINNLLLLLKMYDLESSKINIITSALSDHLELDKIKFIMKLSYEREMTLVKNCYKYNVPQNEINKLLNEKFDIDEIKEICLGLKNGLSIDDIKSYAYYKPRHWRKMEQIRLNLENKQSISINSSTKEKTQNVCVNQETINSQVDSSQTSDYNKPLDVLIADNPADVGKTTDKDIGKTTDNGQNKDDRDDR